MRDRRTWFLVGWVVVFFGLVVFAPSYGWRIREWFSRGEAGQAPDAASLAAENETLKAELARVASVISSTPQAPKDYLRAMVYSRYPLNFKNELLVNAGANDGVAVGKPVVFQNILIGNVEKVFSDTALVRTAFDSEFKIPVRIGTKGYDGLLTGGSYPKVTSIRKDATVAAGDIVYAAAPGFPYGTPIAVVAGTNVSTDHLFTEADLSFAYDVSAVQAVLILK